MSVYETQDSLAIVVITAKHAAAAARSKGESTSHEARASGIDYVIDLLRVAFPSIDEWAAERKVDSAERISAINKRLGERAYFATGDCEGPGTIYRVREAGHLLEKMVSCAYCDGLMPAGRTHCGRKECFELAPNLEVDCRDDCEAPEKPSMTTVPVEQEMMP